MVFKEEDLILISNNKNYYSSSFEIAMIEFKSSIFAVWKQIDRKK